MHYLRVREIQQGKEASQYECSNFVHHNPHLGSSERLLDAVDDIREVEDVGERTRKSDEALEELVAPENEIKRASQFFMVFEIILPHCFI